MDKKRNSIDGFVPRRSGRPLGGQHGESHDLPEEFRLGSMEAPRHEEERILLARDSGEALQTSDIHESLGAISDEPAAPPKKRKSKKRIIKWIIIVILLALLAFGGWAVYKVMSNGSHVFSGGIIGFIQNKELKMDKNGRTNMLVVGTTEDEAGHEGASLTDSMMVISINQKTKDAAMLSIPRDLYVNFGMGCNSGYKGKINEYFNCVDTGTDAKAEQKRLAATQKFVGDIVGLDIQYGVHVNNTVIKGVVDALGGITVNIESRNPNGILDSNFDWICRKGKRYITQAEIVKNCPPRGHYIDLPIGPAKMDGEKAMFFSRARGVAAPTYGLEESNFDREKNQQKILVAIKEKAVSSGTITDFGKVFGIMDAIGENLRTNFDTSEIRTLIGLGKDIKVDAITKVPFVDENKGIQLMGSQMVNGASVVAPTAGTFNYTEIQKYVKKMINASPVAREGASVIVLNGSGVVGLAQTEAHSLEDMGMTIEQLANAPTSDYPQTMIYQIAKDKPATLAKLEEKFGVKALTTNPPVATSKNTHFVIIIGKPKAQTTQSAGQ